MTTTTTTTYAITRDLDQPFDEVVGRVRQELAAEGFGVLTEIDVQATLKREAGSRRSDPYVILGACNPNLAQQRARLRARSRGAAALQRRRPTSRGADPRRRDGARRGAQARR